ncbi:hypothetical protein FQB35_08085 [Crassaminicella thermophila]|uniref:ABC-three component systems C-terminal domain-containing protein n=1 Tax=Crassaminicella thermophila TaxID=2599308 RepID=A0A5C0SGI6_CRATE|nr:ABC-three component system protein [Crassaminicella thermophila]QEK12338.1 hypothetical protein FQB35_08085 [Crassaminicella thermophila]
MQRDFRYLRDKYGEAGARDIFESICVELYQHKYQDAHSIKVSRGDGGIDIYIGNFEETIEVYQCKYFLDGIGDSQKSQIRESFKTAVNSDQYKVNNWYLCIPNILTIDETKWWWNWKTKMETEYRVKIILRDGSYLLSELKKHNLYSYNFDDELSILLEQIREYLGETKKYYEEEIYELDDIDEIDYTDCMFIKKLESAKIHEHDNCQREFFNAEIVKASIESKDNKDDIKMFRNLGKKIHSVWNTQYIRYTDTESGINLLANVYERIEDLDSTTLKAREDISLLAKKGILHQLANDCKVGWVKNYIERLEEYIKEKE